MSTDTTPSSSTDSSTAFRTTYTDGTGLPPGLDDYLVFVPGHSGHRHQSSTATSVAPDVDLIATAATPDASIRPTLSVEARFSPVDDTSPVPTHALHVEELSLAEATAEAFRSAYAETVVSRYNGIEDRREQSAVVGAEIEAALTDLAEQLAAGRALVLSQAAHYYVLSTTSVRHLPTGDWEVEIDTAGEFGRDTVLHLSPEEWTASALGRQNLHLPPRPSAGPTTGGTDVRNGFDWRNEWPVLRRAWGAMADADTGEEAEQ
ncbi:hypothetical protein ACFPYI_20970 [Halomarina salina]|uniref:Histidine phosphatase family protein n=1 Tax=Halomarina salina TaxID=1872699 RepID=A0ABD5RTB5_9EURY|nr:hypothetical protein [Halomarina salina]